MSSVDVAMNAKLFLDGIIFRSSINDYCYGKIRIGFSTMNELQVSPMAVQLRKAKDYTNQRLLYNTMVGI